ncbi:SDR family oxidoreductase [Candidatus Poriferisodalis sp.]|uniref:SDR family oxidoreductase n=1 Tax=Candidatus Poriferisodalis sp. TaxID=3101277 RepID=UPI003D139DEC
MTAQQAAETGAASNDDAPGGRVAVITGGGTGVGKACALSLSQAGWQVVICGRRRELLDDVVGLCASEALAVTVDVSVPEQVDALFAAATDQFGRVDLLFNNAGMATRPMPVDELPIDDWMATVAVNLTGSWLCARAAFAHMKRQRPSGGRIINNGSVSAQTPRPYSSPYTATKHAITGLTKALSLEGRSHAITVGQIDIGNAESPLTQAMASGVPQPDGSIRAEPLMDADDVARAVLYMAELPADANVLTMTVMANGMPLVGRG